MVPLSSTKPQYYRNLVQLTLYWCFNIINSHELDLTHYTRGGLLSWKMLKRHQCNYKEWWSVSLRVIKKIVGCTDLLYFSAPYPINVNGMLVMQIKSVNCYSFMTTLGNCFDKLGKDQRRILLVICSMLCSSFVLSEQHILLMKNLASCCDLLYLTIFI